MSVTTIDAYGAIGNGIADDSAAIAAMDADPAQPYVVLGNGNYKVAANLTIGKRVKKYGVGFLSIPTGVTVTLSKQFSAKRELCFSCTGTGKVVFTIQPLMGFPEWWGAVPNNSGADCLAAINASIIACSITDLAGKSDYYVSGTVLMQMSNRKMRGAVASWVAIGGGLGPPAGSRIVIADGNATAVFMGASSNPTGDIANNLVRIHLEDLTIGRSVQIGTGSAIGVDNRWTLLSGAERCEFTEHKIGYQFYGTVQTHVNKCVATRYIVGSSPSTDQFYGYLTIGSTGLQAAGGNASTYITESTALCNLSVADCPTSIGIGLSGPSADTFVHRCEVTACRQGIVVAGGTVYSGDADIHITECVCDGCGDQGILFSNLNNSAVIHHSGNYYAGGKLPSFTGIAVTNCIGMISSAGNQVVGWNVTATGIGVTGGKGFMSRGDMLLDCTTPVQIDGASHIDVEPIITQNQKVATSGCVMLKGNSNRCRISPIISGVMVSPSGVNLAAATMIEVNVTTISPGAVTNKLMIAGVAVTTTGLVSSHLITGLF